MANKVSFIIQLKNQFGATARKIKQDFKGIDTSAKQAGKSVEKMGRQTKKSMRDSGKAVSGFSLKAKGLNRQLLSMGQGLLTLQTVMSTIKVGAEFEDAIAELSAITGAEGPKLRKLSGDVRSLAKEFGISQSIVAKAFTQTASAKSELLDTPGAVAAVTAEALKLSKAAGVDVPAAIRASVGSLNQFNKGADQAGRFVNVLAAGAKIGASTVGETAEAMKNAGSVAAQFNLSFEQTNALLQVLAKNEIKGAEAGTALRGTLSKLEKFANGKFAPSRMGIIKSLESIEKLGLSNTQIIKEFGEENLRTILILRKNVPLAKEWTKALTGTNVAGEQATKRLSTLSAKYDKLKTSISEVAISILEGLSPALGFVIDKVTFAINATLGVLRSVGSFIGQVAGALSTFDFGSFDFKAIANEFLSAVGEKTLPTTPIQNAGGTVNGTITVAAASGSEVRDTTMANRGPGLDIGMNVPQGAR